MNIELETKSHKDPRLLLLIDPSQSVGEPGKNKAASSRVTKYDTPILKLENSVYHSASIHINTYGRFRDSRAGSYVLTTPKQMTGTQSFLNLSDEERSCPIEDFEDCRVDAFLRVVKSS